MPELQPIDQWSLSNNVSDELQKRKQYSEYVKDSYFQEGKLDSDINRVIDDTLYTSLSDPELGLSEEEIKQQFAPKETPFEQKFDYVMRNSDDQADGYEDLRRYYITKKNLDAGKIVGPDLETYQAAMPELEAKARAATDLNFDKVQLKLLSEGTIPFAKVKDANGDLRYVGGDVAKGMKPYDAYQQGKRMGILTSDDALGIQDAYSIRDGSTVPKFQQNNYDLSIAGAFTLYKNDKDFQKMALDLGKILGDNDKGDTYLYEKVLNEVVDPQASSELKDNTVGVHYRNMIAKLEEKLPELSTIPIADKKAALEYLGGTVAANKGLLKSRTGDEVAKNVHYYGYGSSVIDSRALVDDNIFNGLLASPDFTDKQRTEFTNLRKDALEGNFDSYSQIYKDTYLANDWANAVQNGFAQGKSKPEILTEFHQTHGYSYFKNEFIGEIAGSIPDSYADLLAIKGIMQEDPATINAVQKRRREAQSRRQLANMFGEDFSMTTELGSMVAPVVFDGVTTALLTAGTGVGGAAYAGARLTAKGIVTGILKGSLARGAKESVETAAARIATNNLVKATATQTAQESATLALEAYAKVTANKYAIRSAQFIPSFVRDGSNGFVNIYSALESSPEGKKMTHAEKTDRALAGGLIMGLITGATTVGFSAIGRGGFEDFILGGATPRQLKTVLTKLKNVKFPVSEFEDEASQKLFSAAVADTVSKGLKSMWKTSTAAGVVKDFSDEAVEEGLQDFVNGIVETEFTEQDKPLLDRIKQSGMAAVYGGVFGGLAGGFRKTLGALARGGEIDAEGREAAKAYAINQIGENLRKAGSPLSAAAIEQRAFAPRQKAAAPATAAEAMAAPAVAGTAPVKVTATIIPASIQNNAAIREPENIVVTRITRPSNNSAGLAGINNGIQSVAPTGLPTPKAPAPKKASKAAPTVVKNTALTGVEQVETILANPVEIAGNTVTFDSSPYATRYADKGGPILDRTGEARILDYSGRPVVLASINGIRVPFYISTGSGGKKNVAAGKWYPIFGVGKDGWFNKSTEVEINNFYGSLDLKAIADYLNSTIGDIRGFKFEKVSSGNPESPHVLAMNRDLTPVENNQQDTITKFRENLASLLKRLADSKPKGTADSEAATVAAQQATAEPEAIPEEIDPLVGLKVTGTSEFGKYTGEIIEISQSPEGAVARIKQDNDGSGLIILSIPVDELQLKDPLEVEVEELLNAINNSTPEEIKEAIEQAVIETAEVIKPEIPDSVAYPIAVVEEALIDTRIIFPDSAEAQNLKMSIQDQPDNALAFTKQDYDLFMAAAQEIGIDLDIADNHLRAVLTDQAAVDPVSEVSAVVNEAEAVDTQSIAATVIAQNNVPVSEGVKPKAPRAKKVPVAKAVESKEEAAIKKAAERKRVEEEKQKANSIAFKAIEGIIPKVLESLSDLGALVRFKKNASFGMPANYNNVVDYNDLSNSLALKVYEKYPILSLKELQDLHGLNAGLMLRNETPKLSWFNPFTNEYAQNVNIPYYTYKDGNASIGIFDNNPLTIASMLKKAPVHIPTNFNDPINKAIKFDPLTRLVYDVRFPHPTIPNQEVSIVFKNKRNTTNYDSSLIQKVVSDAFELYAGIKPSIDNKVAITRDLTDLTNVNVIPSKSVSLAVAIDNTNRFFGNIYSAISESLSEKNTVYSRNKTTANKFFKLLDIKALKLKAHEVSDTKARMLIEIIPEFARALTFGNLVQSLQTLDIIERVPTQTEDGTGKDIYSIKADGIEQARSILLNNIVVPSDSILDNTLLINSDFDKKAAFLYTFGFKKGQIKPVLRISKKKNARRTLDPDWATKVVDQFLANSINDSIAHPDENGEFPNVRAIASRIRDRVGGRIKEGRDNKDNEKLDTLSLMTVDSATDKQLYQILTDVYDYDEASMFYSHTKEDAQAMTGINKEVVKNALDAIRLNPKLGLAIKQLARKTVYASNPDLVTDMFPTDCFKAIAEWASPASKRQSVLESYRFRRSFLDHFPSTNEDTKAVYDAFEASGSFQHQIKRKLTKQLETKLISNLGFTSQDIELMRAQRNEIRFIMSRDNVSASEAVSIIQAIKTGRKSWAAPSFISEKNREFYRVKNNQEVSRLRLQSGNAESVIEALKIIAKSGHDSNHKAVAKLLLRNPNFIRSIKFVITDITNGNAGGFTKLESGAGRVDINMAGYYGTGVESVLLHEYVHAFTVDLLSKPNSELTSEQRTAKARLKGIYELTKVAYNEESSKTGSRSASFELATENFEEFIATFFSSSDFQNSMKVLKDTKTKSRNFFSRLYDALLSFFGIKPASDFDTALDALTDFTKVGNYDMTRSSNDYMDRGVQEAVAHGSVRKVIPKESVPTEAQQQVRFASFGSLNEDIEATPEQKEAIDSLIDQAVRSLIPADVNVQVFETQDEADAHGIFADRPEDAIVATLMRDAAGETYPAIFINRANMRNALLNKQSSINDPLNAKAILESIISEELDHVAEFYAISSEEINALSDGMLDQEFYNIIDNYTSNQNRRDQLREALQNDEDGEIKRQLVGEMLRMEMQKISRGYTTEDDIAFYESDPSLMKLMYRYLKGIFKRMYARYNIQKNNPEVAGMIHRMAVELRFMQAGGRVVDNHSPFDPRSPDANVEVLRRRFAATAKEITLDTTDEEIEERWKGVLDTLELPVSRFKDGDYQHMTTKWQKWIKGDIDGRVIELKKNQLAFERSTDAIGKSLATKITRQIKKTYGSEANAPADLLGDAVGTTEFIDADKKFRQKVKTEFRDYIQSLKDRIKAGEFNAETSARLLSNEFKGSVHKRIVQDPIAVERKRLRDEVLRKQSDALSKISDDSPELAASLLEMRKLTDLISRKVKEQYGMKGSMAVRFDANMGIYLTRAYRTFSEEGYVDKVLTSKDEQFVKIRNEAMEFFRELYVKKDANIRVANSLKESKISGKQAITKAEAMIEAKDYLNDSPEIAAQMMVQYLRSYDPEFKKKGVLTKGVTKTLVDNLKKRTNLDPRLRALLGEYSQDTEAVTNLLNTFSTVAAMVSRQSFYNNLISVGSVKPLLDAEGTQVIGEDGEPVVQGFLYTEEQLKAEIKKDPMRQQQYANLRTGKIYTPDSKEIIPTDLGGIYDPTYNMYGPIELIDGMRKMYSPPTIDDNLTGSQLATKSVSDTFNKLTGLSLGIKTLGSITFYLRNIVSNTLFFAPSQGFLNYKQMALSMKLIGQVVADPHDIDAYRAELVALGILNNEMQSSLIKDLLKGRKTPESMKEEADSVMDKIKLAAQKTGVAYGKTAEFIAPLTDRLQALSGAVDGFYKMAYFHYELETFKKAKQADIDAGNTDSFYAKLTENEMRREAAANVLATAQSYSEAPAIIQATVRSGGMFVAPFLRYKTEVPRILFNTYELSIKEMKSGNSVIAKRGLARFTGMTTVLFVLSVVGSAVTRYMFGIGDEEDDSLREGMRDYEKDNTYFYYKWGGKLMAGDLTFVNPFALVVDPIMRGLEQLTRGNPNKAMTDFTNALASTYLDTQIFTGALIDVFTNTDRNTKQRIVYESDGILKFPKKLAYVLNNSFNPRTIQKVWEAYDSADGAPIDPKFKPLRILLDEFKPIRPKEVDVTASATKFLSNKQQERNELTASINKLRTQRALSDDDARELARDLVNARVRIDEEVYRGLRGFLAIPDSKFGIKDAANLMKQADYGDRRISLIFNGLSEKPVINPALIDKVLQLGDVGVQRMNTFNDELNRYTRYIKLNP